jgi:molecular chaperone GrpE (heat shock protein)
MKSIPGPTGIDLTNELWMRSHLDVMRRESEARIQEALIALIEAVDDVRRLRDDPGFGELSPSWRDGVNAVHAKFLLRLQELGVTPIEAVGRKVDPSLHQVVRVVDDSAEEETIIREEMAGYLWRDKVLRLAKVVSAARKSAAKPSDSAFHNNVG